MTGHRNVLIFHSGALGDFVLTWPLLLGVGRVLPQARTMVVTAGEKARLAETVLRVEGRDQETGWPAMFAGGDVGDKPAKLLASAGLVVSFVSNGEDAWADHLRELAPEAQRVFLAPPPKELAGEHATHFILRQLQGHDLLHSATSGMLKSIATTGLMPRLHDPRGPVTIHPGSGSPKKNWDVARWIETIEALATSKRKMKIILGEAELDRLNKRDIDALAEHGDLIRPASLDELLTALRGTSAYVGQDTGPTHLAAICGLPTTALFVSTDATAWRPLGPHVNVADVADTKPADLAAAIMAGS